MVRQHPTVSEARELAVVLHDLAWLLPRTLDPQVESRLDPLAPSELEVMRLLVRRPGLSLGETAQELSLQASNASATVRGLVARGLLERRGDELDGRVRRLYPTAAAIKTRSAREREWARALRRCLTRLSAEDAALATASAPALRALAQELGSPGR